MIHRLALLLLALALTLSAQPPREDAPTASGVTRTGGGIRPQDRAAFLAALNIPALYQPLLVSGTNLKTLNGNSLLGAGNLTLTSDLTSGDVTSTAGFATIGAGKVTNAMLAGFIDPAKISGLGTAAIASATDFAAASAVFYAANYGVTADGTTNDTVALQSAIDAASASISGDRRATVSLPAGMIRLTRTLQTSIGEGKQAINLKSNVNIVGQGMGSTVVKMLDSAPYNCPAFLSYGIIRAASTTINASATITVSSTNDLRVGMPVTGTGITEGATIRTITSGTTLTVDIPATANGSVTLTFHPANIAIENMTIDGNAFVRFSGLQGGEDEGLNFKASANILVSNVRITNCGQDGLDTDAGTDITVSNCVFDRNAGNGIHAVGGGPNRFKIIGCHFLSNGYQRRGADGLGGSGSGVDSRANNLIIDSCTFHNNVVEIQIISGHATITNCQIAHGGASLTNPALTTNLSAIVAGNTSGVAANDGSVSISNCRVHTNVGSSIEIVNTWPLTLVQSNRLLAPGSGTSSGVLATSAGRLLVQGNHTSALYGVFAVSTSLPALVSGNRFEGYGNGLRVEASTSGTCSGNLFAGPAGAVDIQLRSGSTGWRIMGNGFSAANSGIQAVSGGGNSSRIFGNTGGFDLTLASINSIIKGNDLDVITLNTGVTGNTFEENTISGTISHTAVNFSSNTWRRNTGAGCAGIFYGTVTLTSGTSGAINTAAANSVRKWSLTRQSKGSSTAIGSPSIGTITAQTSFVVDALKADATVETGDLSSIYWQILE